MPALDFTWGFLSIEPTELPVSYRLGTMEVARLCGREDGRWYARLDSHLVHVDRNKRIRECSSYESGRRGIEMWAQRHAARLRAEVEEIHRRGSYLALRPPGK